MEDISKQKSLTRKSKEHLANSIKTFNMKF